MYAWREMRHGGTRFAVRCGSGSRHRRLWTRSNSLAISRPATGKCGVNGVLSAFGVVRRVIGLVDRLLTSMDPRQTIAAHGHEQSVLIVADVVTRGSSTERI